ncbi:uracil-xanthine permease [Candidatus Saccharibacteria bacterium]|nr:uracil-xanthine permease [Candidatus Saccharibacteria bacterium]
MINTGDTPITDARRQLNLYQIIVVVFQHVFSFFGATVLVPMITGLSVQRALLFAGIGTLIFHVLTKFKVPAFLGSSFAFLGGFSMMENNSIYGQLPADERLAYACGGMVVAGLMYLILALIIKIVGVKHVMRFLPPVVTGPIIVCIGLSLAPSAIANASTNWLLALVAIVTIIVCNIWGKGMIKIIPILMGVIVSYIVALILNAAGVITLDFTQVAEARLIGLPPLQLAKFGLSAILIMAPISLATMMEHVGDISAISATTGNNFVEDPGLHRTLVGDGLATSIASIFLGPANTTYGENTGVLALTKIYDPFLIRLAAVVAILLGLLPKVAAVINTMPAAIIGGISFVLYGMISAIGVRNMYENHVSLAKSRNLIIVSVILVCGLGFSDGLTFAVGTTSITLTGLAIASIAGIILNAVLPGKDYEFGRDPNGDANRGIAINTREPKDTETSNV